LEQPWSEKCLTLGADVTNYLLGVLFRVTLQLHLLDLGLFFITPLDFGLGMLELHWGFRVYELQ
jgi:hypothetical protein